MINNCDNIIVTHKILSDFEFNINNDSNFSDPFININKEEDSVLFFNDIAFFPKHLNLSFFNSIDDNSTNLNIPIKDIFYIKNTKRKLINKKTSRTKIFIKSLLNLNLSSYEVNHITKLIKSAWILGIYFLLNKKLNLLISKNQFKVEGFVFEFFYVKTSLIETDNTEENLKLFDICLKDLLTGNLLCKNSESQNNNIKNNKNLINFLNEAVQNNIFKKDEDFIKTIKEILLILENNISYFAESIWKDYDKCNEIQNEFKNFCNKEILINKFKKSKEVIKIIINKIESEYPNELEKIKKSQKIIESKKKDNNNNKNYLNKLEENYKIKCYVNEIIGRILEISKKEKFEIYFREKIKKKKYK